MRRIGFILVSGALLWAGCTKKQSAENPPLQKPPVAAAPMQTIARVHWSGMTRISHQTNAASVMAICNLPETRKLQQQTLDKLAFAPWHLLHRNLDTNAAKLFQPLLDDIVSNECCLEIRGATNQPDAMVFAIRLNEPRAALWQTNLARVLQSLTDIQPVPAPADQYGWSLKKHHAPDLLELTRAGDWTIFGASQADDSFVAEIKSRIRQNRTPVSIGDTNDWLEADVNPSKLVPALGAWNLEFGTWNHLHLAIIGNKSNVLTRAVADFDQPLRLDLEPWNIPSKLIDQPLTSFTLVRGFQSLLASSEFWTNLNIGPAPDQICFWGMKAFPMESYFAAPLSDASNEVLRIADMVLQHQDTWFPTNGPARGLAKFARAQQFHGLEWQGAPYMMPFLRSIAIGNHNFICGGGLQNVQTNPESFNLPPEILNQTNLVYYDHEQTGARMEQWLYITQFARVVLNKAELPSDSKSILWMKSVPPRLGESITEITQTAPNALSFERKSTIGLTAIELHLLGDWLESPQFPVGLHTFLAPPEAPLSF